MKNLIKILKYAKKYRFLLALAVISMIVQTGASLYAPKVLQKFVAVFEDGGDKIKETVILLSLTLLIAYILQAIGTFGKSYLTHLAAWNFVHDIRVKLFFAYRKPFNAIFL